MTVICSHIVDYVNIRGSLDDIRGSLDDIRGSCW